MGRADIARPTGRVLDRHLGRHALRRGGGRRRPEPHQPGERVNVLYTVFVGDLQGSPRCDNAIFTEARDRFNSFSGPMVYVPGDNEWTDCHVGGQDPIERLAYLRKVMFPSNHSFGKRTLTVQQQPQYPENSRWETKSVVFAGINVPGSNNNHIADVNADETDTPRGPDNRRAAEAEYQARDEANRVWLHETFAAATQSGAPAVVIAMQADPGWDVASGAGRPAGLTVSTSCSPRSWPRPRRSPSPWSSCTATPISTGSTTLSSTPPPASRYPTSPGSSRSAAPTLAGSRSRSTRGARPSCRSCPTLSPARQSAGEAEAEGRWCGGADVGGPSLGGTSPP